MAGGEGSRLRPLTCDCPKPMLRLMGKPLMEYAIELLKSTGIGEIGATLGYLPDEIQDYFGEGGALGVSLRYYIEKMPLGTAGSVGQARDFLDERFIVLSGDGITDFDLAAAVRFHEKRDAMATLVLCRCPNPQEYGMVVTDGEGRIRSFHEKPGPCDMISDRINTGIYILEPEVLKRIPENCPYDFGHDLFPALVAEEMPVFGYTADGYWCDVGDIGAYLKVHADAMDGKIRLPSLSGFGGAVSAGAVLEPGCVLETPCFVSPGAQISTGAQIGPYSVIGPGCCVHPGASVKRSVLFKNVRVEAGAQLRGCVAGTGAAIGESAQLYEESVVGSHSSIGARAVLAPGVKLWPEKALPEGVRPDGNIVWGSRREQRFAGGVLQLDSPAQATRAAGAVCAAMEPRDMLIGRSGSTIAAALWHAAASGAMAQGVQVVDAGVCSLPQLRHALGSLHADAALMVCEEGLLPLNGLGARISEKQQRAILKLCERQDYSGPFTGLTRPLQSAGRTDLSYIAAAAARFSADPELAPELVLCSQNVHLLQLAEQACLRAGLKLRTEWNADRLRIGPGELGILFSDSGEEALFVDACGRFDETQRQLACAWTALEGGASRLVLSLSATRGIEALAKKYNAHAVYPSGERAAWMNALAEREPEQFVLQFDGLIFALMFLSRLVETGMSLDRWRMELPPVYRSARMLRVPLQESGRILRTLAEEFPDVELGGGLRLPREDGWAWLSTGDAADGLEIIAEAADMETAAGMCDFYEDRLRRLLNGRD